MPTVTIGENTGDDFTGSTVITLYENAPTTWSNSLNPYKYSTGNWGYGLVYFPGISNLPASITVSSATLWVCQNIDGGGTHTFTARRVLRDVDYTDAHWEEYDDDANLARTTDGGISNGNDRSSSVTGTSEPIADQIDVYYELIQDSAQFRADIEDMAANPSANYGWHIERTDGADDFTQKIFRPETSIVDNVRPYLEITYTEAGGAISQIPVILQNYRNMGYKM